MHDEAMREDTGQHGYIFAGPFPVQCHSAQCACSAAKIISCSFLASGVPLLPLPLFCFASMSGVEPRLLANRGSAPGSSNARTVAEHLVRTAR